MKLYDILIETERFDMLTQYAEKMVEFLKQNPGERKNVLSALYAEYKKKK